MKKSMWVSDHGNGRPGYLAEVMRVGQRMPMDGIYQIEVRYDDWCDLLMMGGNCNCEPEVHPGKKLA